MRGEELFIDREGFGEERDVLGAGSGLTVDEGGDGDFAAAELLGEGLEGDAFGCFGGEEGAAGLWEEGVLGCLRT